MKGKIGRSVLIMKIVIVMAMQIHIINCIIDPNIRPDIPVIDILKQMAICQSQISHSINIQTVVFFLYPTYLYPT